MFSSSFTRDESRIQAHMMLGGREIGSELDSRDYISWNAFSVFFFNAGEKEVVVKARGRAISRAVDTVELLRRAFVKDVKIKSIDVGTEQLTGADGPARNVSTMEITLNKANPRALERLRRVSAFQKPYSPMHSVACWTTLCVVWINYKTSFVLIGYLSGEQYG